MSHPQTILIAGGGIGGITLALACLKYGFKVEIFEQAPVLGEIGAGVQISPAGMRVLDALGLKDRILAECYNPVGREMIVWNTGYRTSTPTRSEEVIARYGYPHVTMHRADLHNILVDVLEDNPNVTIHLNAKVAGFEEHGDGVTLHLADGRKFSGTALVGADGLHSAVRRQHIGPSKPQFTGGISWRGLIPIETLPEEVRPKYAQNWVGTNGHFVVYPIRRGELVNIVGHKNRDDWQVESWTTLGTTEEISNDFAGWHSTIQTLIRAIEKPYKWALFLHPTLQSWSKGRVTLLGDACHPTLPYLASGANMAIEDGYVLARCLRHFDGNVEAAFKRYEELRIPRTTDIVNASAGNLKRFRHPDLGDPESAKRYVDSEAIEQRDTREWLFTYDATRVAI
ncbi:FAD-dependent monooxygenase [Ferrovibrio sp.]|uniref:FAD-dependent monooxygenase n=1 Tax=Ferrovibrio sp. TaxID=1917215 RepID=UPI003D2B432F